MKTYFNFLNSAAQLEKLSSASNVFWAAGSSGPAGNSDMCWLFGLITESHSALSSSILVSVPCTVFVSSFMSNDSSKLLPLGFTIALMLMSSPISEDSCWKLSSGNEIFPPAFAVFRARLFSTRSFVRSCC